MEDGGKRFSLSLVPSSKDVAVRPPEMMEKT